MKLADAIASTVSLLADEDIVVAAAGVGTALFSRGDRPRNLYLHSTRGGAVAVALGLALARLERVVAIDVADELLRDPGSLALVGARRPLNLYHLVVNDGATTLGLRAQNASSGVDLSALAASSGYVWSRTCFAGVYGPMALEQWYQASGPAFLDLVVDRAPAAGGGERLPQETDGFERFRKALAS